MHHVERCLRSTWLIVGTDVQWKSLWSVNGLTNVQNENQRIECIMKIVILRTFGWSLQPLLNECYMEANFLANFQNEYQRIKCMKNIILKAFGWSLKLMLNLCYMENSLINFQNDRMHHEERHLRNTWLINKTNVEWPSHESLNF
jgi:hypothetical protein